MDRRAPDPVCHRRDRHTVAFEADPGDGRLLGVVDADRDGRSEVFVHVGTGPDPAWNRRPLRARGGPVGRSGARMSWLNEPTVWSVEGNVVTVVTALDTVLGTLTPTLVLRHSTAHRHPAQGDEAMTVPTLRLIHGAEIPQLGLGTSPMDDAESERVVADAIAAGYRLIDTAEAYGNEVGVGAGIKASSVSREELFVTTKFNKRWHGEDLAAQAYEGSVDRLGLDYLDLLLIHWPNPGVDRYVQAWDGLVQLLETGRVRAIGTSNFKPAHLDRIITETSVVPDVNQIQLNPAVSRAELRIYHAASGIVTESWSPIGGRGAAVLTEPMILRIAEEVGRSPAQVVLRWHVELGLVAVPKSSDPDRLRQNIDVFGFRLTDEQIAALSALDRGEAAATDSDAFGH